MKNLKTVFLFVASLFLFFSCANDFGEGSAYVRIDPSIFSRVNIEDSSTNAYSYEVAIMGESMEPIWKTGTSSASVTLEFPDLPVGEKVFVYALMSLNSDDQQPFSIVYSACSDDFIVKRGYQPVSLKLKNSSDIPMSFFFNASTGNILAMSSDSNAPDGTDNLNISIYEVSVNDYENKRLTFTISSGNLSKTISIPCNVTDYWVNISLYCDTSRSYTVSDVKLDAFGIEYESGNFKHKVIKYPGSQTYRHASFGFTSSSFISD